MGGDGTGSSGESTFPSYPCPHPSCNGLDRRTCLFLVDPTGDWGPLRWTQGSNRSVWTFSRSRASRRVGEKGTVYTVASDLRFSRDDKTLDGSGTCPRRRTDSSPSFSAPLKSEVPSVAGSDPVDVGIPSLTSVFVPLVCPLLFRSPLLGRYPFTLSASRRPRPSPVASLRHDVPRRTRPRPFFLLCFLFSSFCFPVTLSRGGVGPEGLETPTAPLTEVPSPGFPLPPRSRRPGPPRQDLQRGSEEI